MDSLLSLRWSILFIISFEKKKLFFSCISFFSDSEPSATRSVLQKLQQENQALIKRLECSEAARLATNTQRSLKEEEEDDNSKEDDEELETYPIMSGKRGPPCLRSSESGKRHCKRPDSLKLTDVVNCILYFYPRICICLWFVVNVYECPQMWFCEPVWNRAALWTLVRS